MLQLIFIDIDGNEGTIDAELNIEYDGYYHDELETQIQRLTSNESPPDVKNLFQEFLVELYEEVPLTEITIVENPGEE